MKYSIEYIEPAGRRKQGFWKVFLAGTHVEVARIFSNAFLSKVFDTDGKDVTSDFTEEI